jgi:hypothetical protein
MDWNDVAQALADAAETTGINAYDYVPDSLANTAFYVGEIDIDTNVTFGSRSGTRRGTDQGTVTCRVLIARSDDKHALRKCRDYMSGSGARSLIQAIQADRTLDGSVHDSMVRGFKGNRLFVVGEKKYYGIEIDVFVIGDA